MRRGVGGGTVLGWILGLICAGFGTASLYYSMGVSAGVVTAGAVGLPEDMHSAAGVCLAACVVAYVLAKGQRTG